MAEENEALIELGQMQAIQQQVMPVENKNPRGTIYCITIIGHIEGHMVMPPTNKTTKYEHIIPMLVEVNQNPHIDGVLILLNTVGGDVEAGLAIAELISGIAKPTVSLVLGGGHSIGVPLAVSSDFSFIAPSATMTIHPIRMSGTMVGAPQTYDYFEKMQERVLKFVCSNSKIEKSRLKRIMLETGKIALDVGTVLIGEEAVKERLIDSVGGINDAVEKLYQLIKKNKQKKKR